MEIFSRPCPGRSGDLVSNSKAQNHKKPHVSCSKTAASASYETKPINALNALRDGTSCSERLW
jgi:hypothetical protein